MKKFENVSHKYICNFSTKFQLIFMGFIDIAKYMSKHFATDMANVCKFTPLKVCVKSLKINILFAGQ